MNEELKKGNDKYDVELQNKKMEYEETLLNKQKE